MFTKVLICLLFSTMGEFFTLYDFNKDTSITDWKVIDDTVMGGVSNGKFKLNEVGNAVFYGHVSLENNGGFSSVRHKMESLNVQPYSHFEIRLKGDGKPYQFRSRSESSQRHSYIFKIQTTGDWQTVNVPFTEMYPAFRGNTLSIPNYAGETLAEVAFLIGNKEEQDFTLEIDYIRLK